MEIVVQSPMSTLMGFWSRPASISANTFWAPTACKAYKHKLHVAFWNGQLLKNNHCDEHWASLTNLIYTQKNLLALKKFLRTIIMGFCHTRPLQV
jgi:hypothetical protein